MRFGTHDTISVSHDLMSPKIAGAIQKVPGSLRKLFSYINEFSN